MGSESDSDKTEENSAPAEPDIADADGEVGGDGNRPSLPEDAATKTDIPAAGLSAAVGGDGNRPFLPESETAPPPKKKRRAAVYLIAVPAVIVALLVIGAVWFANTPGMGKPTVPVVARPTDLSTNLTTPAAPTLFTADPSAVTAPGSSDVPYGTLGTDPIYQQTPSSGDIVNILVAGLDARPGDKDSRTDSMMIVSWDKSKHTVAAISLMRDMLLSIPGVGMNRLNAAYYYGGIGKLINTVNDTFGLDIQKYIIADFTGATRIIDLIGGVDVQLTQKEASYINSNTPGKLTAGLDHLTGIQALWHMRDRHSTPNSDFDRVKRQQATLAAAFANFKLAAKNPLTLAQLVTDGYGAVTTNFSLAELTGIFTDATSGGAPSFSGYTVPEDGTYSGIVYNGADVLQVDVKANAAYIQGILYGN